MTAPVNIAVGDVFPTAAAWNNLVSWLGGTARAYTPILTSSGTAVQQGFGASEIGRYRTIGKQVDAEVTILFGSSGAAAGTGTYFVSLPVNCTGAVTTYGGRLGQGEVQVNGLWTRVTAVAVSGNPTVCKLKYVTAAVNGSFNDVGSSTPGVWTNNDEISLQLSYESA